MPPAASPPEAPHLSPCRCSLFGGSDYKLIYRHYATLYFVFCVDSSESELGILDLIQVGVSAGRMAARGRPRGWAPGALPKAQPVPWPAPTAFGCPWCGCAGS